MAKRKNNSKWKDPRKDQRSNEELFAATLKGKYDSTEPWDAVRVLRIRGTEEIFELARKSLNSKSPLVRARALDILAQMGSGKPDTERPFMNRSVSLAVRYMDDKSSMVRHSAAWALAHLRTHKAIERLIKARRDRNKNIRHAVAQGLGNPKSRDAIRTLIGLMDDRDKHIRDWATFSLSLTMKKPVDSPAIRKALRKRLDDSFADARAEAIWGLARRRDMQGLQLLLRRLSAKSWSTGDEMAATETLKLSGETPIEELRAGIEDLLARAK